MARNPVLIDLKRKMRQSLERKRKKASNPKIARRISIILMADDGYEVADIRAATGASASMVFRARKRWLEEGLQGLKDKPIPGRPPTADAEYLVELMATVTRSPSDFGYIFSVWTTARLAEHLFRTQGKRVCADRVGVLLRSCGYVWGRPKHTLEGKRDEEAYTEGKRRLRLLKKGGDAKMPPSSSSSSTKRDSTSTPIWLVCGESAAAR